MSASFAPAPPSLPRCIGRYTLFDRIGRGGMADIFLARAQTDLGVSRLAVVKQILPHLADSPEFAELLITEAKLAARLDHANIVQVHDLGRIDGFLYIAMQYVEGFDLNELLRRCSRSKIGMPVEYGLFIITEVLRGLDYAHRKTAENEAPLGIVHRDVSPSNILISFEGEVKICDFGIAHANDAVGPDAYSEDIIKGKAGYMSPEQALGKPLDARADVFAIGIVLWELLAGRKLYKATPETPMLEQAQAARIPDLPSRSLPLEEKLFAISRKALAPERDDRYVSAQSMLFDLEQYVGQSKLIASPIRFGEWLIECFGEELILQRRERERAVQMLEAGARAEVLAELGSPLFSRRSLPPDDDGSGAVGVRASSPPTDGASVPFAHIVEDSDRSTSHRWMALVGIVLITAGSAVLYVLLSPNR